MSIFDSDDETSEYRVLINDEGQYSVWPVRKANPSGWKEVGKSGPKSECLVYIKNVWTDMMPLSVRRKLPCL